MRAGRSGVGPSYDVLEECPLASWPGAPARVVGVGERAVPAGKHLHGVAVSVRGMAVTHLSRAHVFSLGVLACSVQAVPAGVTPSHDVTVLFDAGTGVITVEAVISDAEALVLTPEDWIEVEALQIGGDIPGQVREVIALSSSEIAGQAVTVRLGGRLPQSPDIPARFGAFPEGAFLFGAEGWLPLSPDGRGVFNITVQTAAEDRGVATGTLVAEHLDASSYSASFRFEGPADDLAVFFGGYVVDETMAGDLRLRTYFPERHAGEAEAYLRAMADYIARYEALIGAYPFDGFAVVAAPIPVGYGLRGLTYVSTQILHLPYMRGRSLAHEILHSWWGHGVRIDYDSGNWGEGLTTYQADYALAEAEGPDAAREMRREWLRQLSVLPDALDIPAREFRSSGHGGDQSIGYDKLAMVFHMLRGSLGAEVFDAGVRLFWEANRGRTAAWPDLQAAFEEASGVPLHSFFAQWLDRAGLPEISVAEVHVDAAGGQHVLTLTLAQAEPAFVLDVPIVVETEAGRTEVRMPLAGTEATSRVPLPARPTAVQVDPDYHVLRRLPRGELPDSFREAFLTATATLVLPDDSGPADGAADLAARLAPGAGDADPSAPGDSTGAVLAVGGTVDIAALRDARIGGEAPAIATNGASRAWVERDADDRLWMFVSADDTGDLGSLSALRYFGAFSYVAFDGGRPIETGSWPVADNPLRMELP